MFPAQVQHVDPSILMIDNTDATVVACLSEYSVFLEHMKNLISIVQQKHVASADLVEAMVRFNSSVKIYTLPGSMYNYLLTIIFDEQLRSLSLMEIGAASTAGLMQCKAVTLSDSPDYGLFCGSKSDLNAEHMKMTDKVWKTLLASWVDTCIDNGIDERRLSPLLQYLELLVSPDDSPLDSESECIPMMRSVIKVLEASPEDSALDSAAELVNSPCFGGAVLPSFRMPSMKRLVARAKKVFWQAGQLVTPCCKMLQPVAHRYDYLHVSATPRQAVVPRDNTVATRYNSLRRSKSHWFLSQHVCSTGFRP